MNLSLWKNKKYRKNKNVWEPPPLHRAALFGDVTAMERLIAKGADINARTGFIDDWMGGDLTPLMFAALSTDGATAETLAWMLDHGADLRATSDKGVTAASFAAGDNGRWKFGVTVQGKLIRALEARPAQTNEFGSPKSASFVQGKREERNNRGGAIPDHAERLRLLLDAGLDPQESWSNGRSLIVEACRAGDPARVRVLLERGVPPHYTGKRKKSPFQIPLFCAAQSGSAECARLLLDAGADAQETTRPETQTRFPGETALAHAASPDVARVLLEAGARVDARDSYQDVLGGVLDAAARNADAGEPYPFAVADVLLEAGASLNGRLYTAAFRQQDTVVEWLLARGASYEPGDTWGTPLHAVCWGGGGETFPACERVIRALVATGVPTEARDGQGQTPLHKAVDGDWGNICAVRTLLELGADPNSVDPWGQTPLHSAVLREELACYQALLAGGADPLWPDAKGLTPVNYMEIRKRMERRGRADGSTSPNTAEEMRERAARYSEIVQEIMAGRPAPCEAAPQRSPSYSGDTT